MHQELPDHLKRYVVTQNYEKYTPVDQAVWRYVLRQLKSFLKDNAHECYIDGLEKTGISTEQIPRIEEISEKIEKFGWKAVPVSGFIPPAAFMELQSLGYLPIASDMRSLDHLLYTPAPDIVHEAAGHAPILINQEFADYLKEYAQVAKKSILSSQDIQLYEAIRDLSDLKENPNTTAAQVTAAEKRLHEVSTSITYISEAAQLARMNWWTAEYGLIGTLENPKIFGAGLLSSVGEANWCLSPHVKKIPISLQCIETGYDITEPQPQLFVTPDFPTLTKVLQEFAKTMAFKVGGTKGLHKAIQSNALNTVELNSGLQISGVVVESLEDGGKSIYFRTQGPTQLSVGDQQLEGHSKDYHSSGFSSPLGKLMLSPARCLSEFKDTDLKQLGILVGENSQIHFSSGVFVNGKVEKIHRENGKIVLITLKNCTVRFKDRILFEPAWGNYDMAVGHQVVSVFGGPADRKSYGETDDFSRKTVPLTIHSAEDLKKHALYQDVRALRVQMKSASTMDLARLSDKLQEVFMAAKISAPKEWLLYLEIYEIISHLEVASDWRQDLKFKLDQLSDSAKVKPLIAEGLKLAQA